MRTERSSPGTVEAPRPNAAEKVLRLARKERTEKEEAVLRTNLMKHARGILRDLDLPFEIEEDQGKLELDIDVETPFSLKEYEGFDMDEVVGNPNYRTESRTIPGTGITYVVTERIRDKRGVESGTVRPDGHGAYPDKEDLDAAMQHDFFMAQRWFHQERIFPEDASLIMHHYHSRPKEWIWQAMDALMAAYPEMEPEQAASWAGTVIKNLIDSHRKRVESL